MSENLCYSEPSESGHHWVRLKCPVYRSVLISEVVKYTNVSFETDESVLLIEVSSIQRCPYREREREVPLYIYTTCTMYIQYILLVIIV